MTPSGWQADWVRWKRLIVKSDDGSRTATNVGQVLYKDDAGVCYRYKKKQIQCPVDPKKITELKPQQAN